MKFFLLFVLTVFALRLGISAQVPAALNPEVSSSGETKYGCSHSQAFGKSERLLTVEHPSAIIHRPYDILSYNLFMDWAHPLWAVSVGAADRSFTGKNTITLRIDSANITTITLNAATMRIDSVFVGGQKVSDFTQPLNQQFEITLKKTPAVKTELTLDVYYTFTGMSNKGFFLYPKGDSVGLGPVGEKVIVEESLAYTMSEPQDARYWMPCNDQSYDKAMSEITVRVPAVFTVASNGLLQERKDNQDGTLTYHWKNYKPISTYLMAATASIYEEFSDWYHRVSDPSDSVEVKYFVWQKDYENTATDGSQYNARNAFKNTPLMMAHFSTLYGEYPFEKYGMVAVQPFDYGGMEHQTMTTIIRRWLRGQDESGIAHELMHQWTGDKVTCASFADIWLNEGGATFGEALWAEKLGGEAAYNNILQEKYAGYRSGFNSDNSIPIYNPPLFNIFNYATTYAKAGWVYHMLRRMLGDDVFFPVMRKYFEDFAYRTVETEDMVKFLEKNVPNPPVPFRTFFDQWIYQASNPTYALVASSDEGGPNGYKLQVTLEQTQEQSSDQKLKNISVPSVFVMPVHLTFIGKQGEEEDHIILNDQRVQTESFTVPFAVGHIMINRNYDILADVTSIPVMTVTSVGEDEHPLQSVLLAPNPVAANNQITLTYTLSKREMVEMEIVNMLGISQEHVYSGYREAGEYKMKVRTPLTSGMYFLCLNMGGHIQYQKFIVQ